MLLFLHQQPESERERTADHAASSSAAGVCDPLLLPDCYTGPGDFTKYQRPLQEREWRDFQRDERLFRKHLDTKRLDEKQKFTHTGDLQKWTRLVAILNGVFFKNGVFSASRGGGRQFGLPLLNPNKAPASENIDDDIYDLVDDGGSDPGFPPPPPPAFPDPDGDTYDDVAPSSLSSVSPVKTEDPKKKKRFEKEEKEFRKKFKYDQEIRVLYEAAVLPALACKKFSGKHLVIKPGDVISVITRQQDGKVIGRNSEGKFGFVSLSNIQQNSDIYDDVGEDCIYDND